MTSRTLLCTVGILLTAFSMKCTAFASTSGASSCTAAGVQAASPAGMTITTISDGQPPSGVTQAQLAAGGGVVLVPPNSKLGTPEFCFAQGTVLTNPATGKTANFQAALPTKWNGKFLFKGCMGLCGVTNPPELEAVRHGYATATTDDGHVGNPTLGATFDGSWALNTDGSPNTDAVTDYFYRAVHVVTEAGKSLAGSFYSQAVSRSYYQGCSDGGREGMVEVSRFPDDFDGVIIGDPFFDPAGEVMDSYTMAKVQLRASDAAMIPASLLQVLDTALLKQCDAADGVTDGLIQDPALCNYNPATRLPICSSTRTTNCFTQNQADSIAAWFTAITDPAGHLVYPGFALADVNDLAGKNIAGWAIPSSGAAPKNLNGPHPWGADTSAPSAWLFADNVLRYLIFQNATYNSNSGPGMTFNVAGGKIQNMIPDTTVQTINQKMLPGRADDPKQALPFLSDGRKLILYHGFSDGIMTPYQTVKYYKALASLAGGYPTLQQNARLFMVPGMFHCTGGPGPNVFDALAALENWVEDGIAPDAIPATGGVQKDEGGKPRSMPLCQFPEMASYNGTGDVNNSASWSCSSTDQRLLTNGPNGIRAGLH